MVRSVFSHVSPCYLCVLQVNVTCSGETYLEPYYQCDQIDVCVYIDHNQFRLNLIYVQSHGKMYGDGLFKSGMKQRLLHIIFTLTNGT